ncbi:MAG TPA: hypothetical protein VJ440_00655, partial [Candidatus Brocadiaceae bacterium]|nr:hypothetical protein [Candidatus Brocadiaceae bacterium]
GIIYDLPFINPSLQAGVQTHAYPGFSPDGTQHGILHTSFIHLSEKMCICLWALPRALVLRPFGATIANTVSIGLSVFALLNLTRMPLPPPAQRIY